MESGLRRDMKQHLTTGVHNETEGGSDGLGLDSDGARRV